MHQDTYKLCSAFWLLESSSSDGGGRVEKEKEKLVTAPFSCTKTLTRSRASIHLVGFCFHGSLVVDVTVIGVSRVLKFVACY